LITWRCAYASEAASNSYSNRTLKQNCCCKGMYSLLSPCIVTAASAASNHIIRWPTVMPYMHCAVHQLIVGYSKLASSRAQDITHLHVHRQNQQQQLPGMSCHIMPYFASAFRELQQAC
jgi:hypothetical protein